MKFKTEIQTYHISGRLNINNLDHSKYEKQNVFMHVNILINLETQLIYLNFK